MLCPQIKQLALILQRYKWIHDIVEKGNNVAGQEWALVDDLPFRANVRHQLRVPVNAMVLAALAIRPPAVYCTEEYLYCKQKRIQEC